MKKKICFIVSTPYTSKAFLENHFEVLSEEYDVYLVANLDDSEVKNYSNPYLVEIKHIPIRRKISILTDLKALFLLINYFKKNHFDCVTSFTPKAGLIGTLAAKLAGVQKRIYFFTGQVWHTKTGVFRTFLKQLDKLVVASSTHILVDGKSQQNFLIQNNIVTLQNSTVLGKGTISGIDLERFSAKPMVRQELRSSLNIADDELVFLFLGRINKDKGILDLAHAFTRVQTQFDKVRLIIVGPDEENLVHEVKKILPKNVLFFDSTHEPENLYQIGDVFCLPSHREAFGLSILEASACEKPIICSDTYGLNETIIPNQTGVRHITHDINSLYTQMVFMIHHPLEREKMGAQGRIYVENYFSKEKITTIWKEYYHSLLK